MANSQFFDQILDECLGDIHAQRATVQDCLTQYPDLAAELAPLLETAVALEAVGDVQPSAAFKRSTRAQLSQLAHAQAMDEILDQCLGDLRAGRMSVEACLAQYADWADELAPLLELALALAAVPIVQPSAAFKQTTRAKLTRLAKRHALDEVLEQCLIELHAHHASIDDCLSRYPEWAHELEPLLQTAVAIESVPAVRPSLAFKRAMRMRLTRSPPRRLSLLEALTEILSFWLKPQLRTATLAFSVIVLFISFTAGTIYASTDSLPGSLLYGVKRAGEQVQLALTTDSDSRVRLHMSLAERRLHEVVRLSDAGQNQLADQVATEYVGEISTALLVISPQSAQHSSPLAQELATRLTQHQQELWAQQSQLPASAHGPLVRMSTTAQQAAEWLSGSATPSLTPSPTAQATAASFATSTPSPIPTVTAAASTAIPATPTAVSPLATATPLPPSPTSSVPTSIPPSATPVPASPTAIVSQPSPIPPVATDTPLPPIATIVLPTATFVLPTATQPAPTDTPVPPTATRPVPTPTSPLPTVTLPIPTPTLPLPTVTVPVPSATPVLPTATLPVPTPTVPLPTVTLPVPTPTPFATATVPLPTATIPLPTATLPLPTATSLPLPTVTPLPLPTATLPLPTATSLPLPTATSLPLPTATSLPLPTATLPLPTATSLPLPTVTLPAPTPTVPLPTATVPLPTVTPLPLPTVTLPVPTPTVPLPTAAVPLPTVTPLPLPTIR